MTIILRVDGRTIHTLHDVADNSVHIPRTKEGVIYKKQSYKVKQVTSVLYSDLTAVPTVYVDLKKVNMIW